MSLARKPFYHRARRSLISPSLCVVLDEPPEQLDKHATTTMPDNAKATSLVMRLLPEIVVGRSRTARFGSRCVIP
jgi:hypothetical protein